MQTKMHFSAGKFRSGFSGQIGINKKLYISSLASAGLLATLGGLAVFPVASSFSGVEAAPVVSDTVLTLSTADISLAFNVASPTGTFAASDPARMSVTTNNYTGYTLSVLAKEDNANNSKLINTVTEDGVLTEYALNSISAAGASTSFNNGNWGYMPSKYNSAANTDYLPAPSYTGDTLDVTDTANSNANEYTIALGAKADYSLPAGVYNNTFVIVATANPVGYAISYDANTTDTTVADIPATQTGEVTTTSVTLSNTEPTRTGYAFMDWCDGTVTATMGVDSCDGTRYTPGDNYGIDQTGANIVTLKAMWSRKYTITFDANTGTGNMPDQVITGSATLLDENTFTKTDYDFDGWNTSADGNGTSYADMDNFNVPATGTGETLYAQWEKQIVTFEQAYSNASKSKVLNTKDNKEYYTLQDMNASICSAVSTSTKTDYSDTQEIQVMDTRDEKVYWIAKLLDGHCWMTQNLDHNIVTTAGYYTHDNTDLGWGSDKTTTTWTPTMATINAVTDSETAGSISGWAYNNNAPYSVDTGDWYWKSTPFYYSTRCFVGTNVQTCSYVTKADNVYQSYFSTTPYSDNGTHGHVGNYYNWSAAVASNDTSSYTASTYDDITNNPQNSICPAGWRLPTIYNSATDPKNEYRYLLDKYGAYVTSGSERDKALAASPLYFVRSGNVYSDVYSGSLRFSGYGGYYWSSTVTSSSDAYGPYFYSGDANPSGSSIRSIGRSLRCIAR